MSTDNPAAPSLLSDDPRDGSPQRPDELGRAPFADYLAGLLQNVRSQSESSVLALIGDWGSGKTTILELLSKKLESEWLVGAFNPWAYPDTAALQRGFFAELTATMPKGKRPSNARTKVGDLARTVSPLGALAGVVGVNAEGMLQLAADLISVDTSASAAKRAADDALRKVGRPVLMVIDDLDRLTPDELLEVLKLVRLVGRLPHVYYLLSYDERTLLDVLQQTAIAGNSEIRARAYLEKIVQVRLDMPALRATQRSTLLDRGLEAILGPYDVQLSDTDQRRLSDIYFAVLDRRLTTPRAISRFLGQVQAFYPPLRDEVDFIDFLLVSWLRTQEPGVYKIFQEHRDDLLGRGRYAWLVSTRNKKDADERRAYWQAKIEAAQVAPTHIEGVIRVLSDLFPEIKAAFTESNHYTTATERKTPRAISDTDYYDRYVNFGVPDDDIRDSAIRTALDDLTRNPRTPAVQQLDTELRTSTYRIVRKIEMMRDTGATIPEPELFELFARAWPHITTDQHLLFAPPRSAAERAAALCLITMDAATATETAQLAASDPHNAEFMVNVVQHMHRDQLSPHGSSVPADYDLAALRKIASDAVLRANDQAPAGSPFDHTGMSTFWTWEDIAPDAAHAWLRRQVDTKEWTVLETIGALTTVNTMISAGGARTGVGEFQLATAEHVFTLERLFDELSSDLAAVEPLSGSPFHIPATKSNRIRHALLSLRDAETQRASESVDTL